MRYFIPLCLSLCLFASAAFADQTLKIATFNVDATPPIGSPVAYAPTRSVLDPLSARGIILYPANQKPIVLCAVDWIGIANDGFEQWKVRLAKAAQTDANRVTIHTLHQHDGVRCDFTTHQILAERGVGKLKYDVVFLRQTIARVADAIKTASKSPKVVTHIGTGKAQVEKVASNRRILGDDGKVKIIRFSKSTNPAAIAAPEGVIDSWLRSVTFFQEDKPLAVLTYYATHPQSYYGQGDVTSEFVGLARKQREKETGVLHIHFNGASGNVAAGKYNDGSVKTRPILTARMAQGMEAAWKNTERQPISSDDILWKTAEVTLPLGSHLVADKLLEVLDNKEADIKEKLTAAKHLAWLQRTNAGYPIVLSSLKLNDTYLLHMPGELFVEYQLAAQKMKPKSKVCMAAYAEYGPGYIGTAISYSQGGYETSERASRVSSGSESILLDAMEALLK
ncbi:MAG: hypothetical protein COA78_37030 [Blastopirellula sp.]|nr:MAG: hypothetical protein COA78_37030 [Blastopirellula sp.]